MTSGGKNYEEVSNPPVRNLACTCHVWQSGSCWETPSVRNIRPKERPCLIKLVMPVPIRRAGWYFKGSQKGKSRERKKKMSLKETLETIANENKHRRIVLCKNVSVLTICISARGPRRLLFNAPLGSATFSIFPLTLNKGCFHEHTNIQQPWRREK